jgi:hypothetical protein
LMERHNRLGALLPTGDEILDDEDARHRWGVWGARQTSRAPEGQSLARRRHAVVQATAQIMRQRSSEAPRPPCSQPFQRIFGGRADFHRSLYALGYRQFVLLSRSPKASSASS